MRALDPVIAAADIRPMEEVVSANRFGLRFFGWLTTALHEKGISRS